MIQDVRIAVLGAVDASKCFKIDTQILMYNGEIKKVQDIKIGDIVMGDDSTKRTVIELARGKAEMYDIIPTIGDKYTVTDDHILVLKASNYEYIDLDISKNRYQIYWLHYIQNPLECTIKSKQFTIKEYKTKEDSYKAAEKYLKDNVHKLKGYVGYGDIIEIKAKDYFNLPKKIKNVYKTFITGVEFPEQKINLDPYILGVWLGDEDSKTTRDQTEIVEYFKKFEEKHDLKIKYNLEQNYLYCLKKYNLIGNKHIPNEYKFNTRDIRLQLLAGLLDTDSYLKNNCYVITKKSEKLIDDILYLVRSLGYLCPGKIISCTNDPIYYRLHISINTIDEIPCLLKRKMTKKNVQVKGIDIVPIGITDYYGFKLKENARFLLGDFTVTHNSSIIGTLVSGELDDGNGKNRAIVMNYQHEHESGQTSSVAYQLLGFKENGETVKLEHNELKSKRISWPKIIMQSIKTITFIDLAGHEKYLGTTIYGISSNRPDYCLILVEGKGIRGTTKEHIILCLTFNIPIIILITKIDLYENQLKTTTDVLIKLIKSTKKIGWLLENESQINNYIKNPSIQIPLIPISCVTGHGLDLLKKFLFKLPSNSIQNEIDITIPFEASILETFIVQGIGLVVHLFMVKGSIKTGDIVFIGPTNTGEYLKTKIRSLQYKRTLVSHCIAGKHVCAAIIGIERKMIKTGMYMIHKNVVDRPIVKSFKAQIKVLGQHSTTIKIGYSPVLNVDNIKMAAKIKQLFDKDGKDIYAIRSGDTAMVILDLIYRPVFIRIGDIFVFRDGYTKGRGTILEIL